ncbi:MAG: AraC family transcriptional regulator [Muribaculaceae bacterium]|nr:AraC family transcriptional regulator [Muribaculaceae bacterium]
MWQYRTVRWRFKTVKSCKFAVIIQTRMEDHKIIHYSDGDISLMTDINDLSELNGIKSDSYLFLASRKGRLQIDINGNTHTIKEGERLTVLPQNFTDNILVSVDADIVMLRLSVRIVSDLIREHIDKWNRMIYICKAYRMSAVKNLEEQMQFYYRLILSKTMNPDQKYHKEIIRTIIKAILLEMLSNMETDQCQSAEGENKTQFQFNRFLQILSSEDVKHRPIDFYADRLCISSKYLSVICSKVSGKSARQWIDEYTVEDIRYHLLNTDYSIKEIAYRLGFENLSFFGKYVKRHFGKSPSELRSIRNKRNE